MKRLIINNNLQHNINRLINDVKLLQQHEMLICLPRKADDFLSIIQNVSA